MILTGFAALDNLTGGLQERKNYLAYGDVGTGKTTLSLKFLHQGLTSGETVALVTRRAAQTVFDHAQSFGFDLEAYTRRNSFILLEYVPRVIENTARLRDESQISREFMAFLGSMPLQRLVFDPFTPLLSAPSTAAAIFRARSLIQAFSELGATSLYVFDTPEGEEYLSSCKDFVYGVLRFEAGPFQSGRGRLVVERLPGIRGKAPAIDYEILTGVEITEASPPDDAAPGLSSTNAAQKKILLIEPDDAHRSLLRGLLDKTYRVLESNSPGDGLAKVAAEAPDLIILPKDMEGMDGLEICRRLRQNKLNLPIILIADQIRRTRDRVEIMSAGADECLENPIDGRLLKLRVQNLLKRYVAPRDHLAGPGLDLAVTTAPERDQTTSTTNLAYFNERLRREIAFADDNALSFAVLGIKSPESFDLHKELFQAVHSQVREYDLVYVSAGGIAVLLPETDERGVNAFMARFRERWQKTPEPLTEFLCYDRGKDFFERAKRVVETMMPAPAQPRPGDEVQGG